MRVMTGPTTTTEAQHAPLLVSASEAARMLGIDYRSVLDLIYEGELPARRLHRKYLIPTRAVYAFATTIDDEPL